MTLKSIKYILPVSMGVILCSCSFSRDEEYENFLKTEEEKVRNEIVLLEEQKRLNQLERTALLELQERLKTEALFLYQEKAKIAEEKTQLSQLKQQSNNKKQNTPNYENKRCHNQGDCGGFNSGYFCNSKGNHTPDRCQKTNPQTVTVLGKTFYYNTLADLKSWCREAFESQEDRNNPGNCNWGYLSYDSAKNWCTSIGKELVDANEIEQNCEQFSFLPKANPDQQYWTTQLSVVHTGQNCSVQKMVRGDGYAWAGGVICK